MVCAFWFSLQSFSGGNNDSVFVKERHSWSSAGPPSLHPLAGIQAGAWWVLHRFCPAAGPRREGRHAEGRDGPERKALTKTSRFQLENLASTKSTCILQKFIIMTCIFINFKVVCQFYISQKFRFFRLYYRPKFLRMACHGPSLDRCEFNTCVGENAHGAR